MQDQITTMERREENLSRRLEEANQSWEDLEKRLQEAESQAEDARQKALVAEEKARANTLSHYIISALNSRKRRGKDEDDKDQT